jgi:hypothetical protein
MKNIVSIVGIIGSILLSVPSYAQTYINNERTCTTVQVHKLKSSCAVKSELSAIGIRWSSSTPHYVQYVDPNCDVFQQIKIGDILVAIDNSDPQLVWQKRQNYGSENTVVMLNVSRGGYILNLSCYRHPVSYFVPWFQHGMLPI